MILRTGGGEHEMGMGYGIHWHIENPVEFISTDEHQHDIPWVRVTFPDGRVVEYNDVTHPLSEEEIAAAEIHVMECVDCHNQVGHPFYSPDRLIDRAMAEGRISSQVPHMKEVLLAVMEAEYENQEEAIAAAAALDERFQAEYPEVAAEYAVQIDQAAEVAQGLITRVVFRDPEVTWRDFPDYSGHGGHKEFPGCFRCHDGEHLSSEGESIRLHCNICHSIPEVVSGSNWVPHMPVAALEEPPSHLESNFIADHRFQASEDCVPCHGEIEFGSDDSSFCANSACHGAPWPSVDLDAAFPHPISLEGAHAEVWCHDCHEGVRQPEFNCANCHEPPMATHFGPVCEDCHTTEGWELASLDSFQHPVALEGAHAEADCLACHSGGQELTFECASCHQPPESHFEGECADCHTPTATFADATIPPEMHPIPLVGAHLRATCNVCHADGQRVPEYVCSNCHQPPENHLQGACSGCHTPDGWAESVAALVSVSPRIPHGLEGQENCAQCHDPAGQIMPASATHIGRTNEQCQLCHRLAEE